MIIRQACTIVCLVLSVASGGQTRATSLDALVASMVDSLVAPLPHGSATRIGVLPFVAGERGQASEASTEGRAVAELIVAALVKHPGGFAVVDRMDYEKALGEIALSQSGATSETMEIDIGRFMSAAYLISGTISAVMGQSAIRAKIVKVESGEIVAAAQAVIQTAALAQSASELFSEQQSVLSYAFRSTLLPGWGQFYAGQPVRGTISLALGLGGAGFTVASWVTSANRRNERDAFTELANTTSGRAELERKSGFTIGTSEFNNWQKEERDKYQEDYSQWLTIAKIATAATAGVWVLNIIDGTLAGHSRSRAVKLYFTTTPHNYRAGLALNF